jgi:hypothetical protein
MRKLLKWTGALALALSTHANAALVTGGQTSVALDLQLLESVGLTLTGVTGPVIIPGELMGSVAFPINARDAAAPALATTFEFTPGTVAPFSGTIEHSGGVIFNETATDPGITVGNFTIGFNGTNFFDIANLVILAATDSLLRATGDLLVSTQLAGVLGNANLAGVDVGDALVNAVPEPGALALILVAGLALVAATRGRRARSAIAPDRA